MKMYYPRYLVYIFFLWLALFIGGRKNPYIANSVARTREKMRDDMLAAQQEQQAKAEAKAKASATPAPAQEKAPKKAVVSDFSPEGITKSMMSLAKDPAKVTDTQQGFVNILGDTFRLSKIFETRTRLRMCAVMTFENGRFTSTEYNSTVAIAAPDDSWITKHHSHIPLDKADLYVREFAAYMDGMGWVNNIDAEAYFKAVSKAATVPAILLAENRSKVGPDGKDKCVVIECVLSLYTNNPRCSDDVPELTFATIIETDDAPSTVSSSVYFQRSGIPVA